MKVSCQACQAKYTIADAKVAGKIAKIRCKKCGEIVVINGKSLVSVMAPLAVDDTWTVLADDDQQLTMKRSELLLAFREGRIAETTYCWREDMPDWLPLNEIPDLAQALGQGGEQPDASRDPSLIEASSAAHLASDSHAAAPYIPPQEPARGSMLPPNDVSDRFSRPAPPHEATHEYRAHENYTQPGPFAPAPSASDVTSQPSFPTPSFPPIGGSPLPEPAIGIVNEGPFYTQANTPLAFTPSEPVPLAPPSRPAGPFFGGQSPPPSNASVFAQSPNFPPTAGVPIFSDPPSAPPSWEPPPSEPLVGGRFSSRPGLLMRSNASPNQPNPSDVLARLGNGSADSEASLGDAPLTGERNESSVLFSIASLSGEVRPPKPAESSPASENSGLIDMRALAGSFAKREAPTAPSGRVDDIMNLSASSSISASLSPPVLPGALPSPMMMSLSRAPATSSSGGSSVAMIAGVGVLLVGLAAVAGVVISQRRSATPAAPSSSPSTIASVPSATISASASAKVPTGPAFDKDAARAALTTASAKIISCKERGGPTGDGRVLVTFRPDGTVESAKVESAPFANTRVGHCVEQKFVDTKVPAFSGAPQPVSRSFTIK